MALPWPLLQVLIDNATELTQDSRRPEEPHLSSATPTPDHRRARRNYAGLRPSRAWAVRILVFGAAVLLVAVLQGALFYLLGPTGYAAPSTARPAIVEF